MLTRDQELVSFTLALDEISTAEGVGVKGLQFMCRQAAKYLRQCRPDLSFVEHPTTSVRQGHHGEQQ
jgi:hypothetical protein